MAILSVQPAYQTQRSTAASTTAPARLRPIPSAATTSSTNSSRRACEHLRDPVEHLPRLYAVAPDQPGSAARAALTASRRSLREASAACASSLPLVSVTG